MTRENIIRRKLLRDLRQFARRMWLKYIFHGKDKEPHPFHVKSDWNPPVQSSVALETFLEVKYELASIKFNRRKDNLSQGVQKVLKELSHNKNIVIKNADKGTITVKMNRTDKLNEGQVKIDDIHNHRPSDNPMVVTTAKKVH